MHAIGLEDPMLRRAVSLPTYSRLVLKLMTYQKINVLQKFSPHALWDLVISCLHSMADNFLKAEHILWPHFYHHTHFAI